MFGITEINSRLHPHQHEPVRQLLDILSRHQSALNISDTGVGKTYVAAAVAKALQLPTLVVCPKIVVSAWHRAAQHFGDTLSVINYEKLQTGRTDFGNWEKAPVEGISKRTTFFTCQCCQQIVDVDNSQPCYTHPKGIHCIVKKHKEQRLGNFVFHRAIRFVIFDEIHRCGALDSLNADMLVGVKRQNIKMLGLSATAAVNPLNMRALGFNLDLHGDKVDRFAPNMGEVIRPVGPSYEGCANRMVLPNFYKWAGRYGCQRDPAFHGFKWLVSAERQQQVMAEIRSSIIPARGVRVRFEDIPGFPERVIENCLYNLYETNQIDVILTAALQRLDKKAEGDKSPDSPLTKILRARQKIELLKIPIIEELVFDYLVKGFSIAVFVNFEQTRVELMERLKTTCSIHGGQSVVARDAVIEGFQSNRERVIVVNNEAGGVGLSLHDVDGMYPRLGLVMPTFSAVTFRQVLGRLHRDGGKSTCYYKTILIADTVEEKIKRALDSKLRNLNSLNDGDFTVGISENSPHN